MLARLIGSGRGGVTATIGAGTAAVGFSRDLPPTMAVLYSKRRQDAEQQREEGGDGQGNIRAGSLTPDVDGEVALGGLEPHGIDDPQVVRGPDDAGNQADHGEAVEVGVDGGDEHKVFAEEARRRGDAGQREHEQGHETGGQRLRGSEALQVFNGVEFLAAPGQQD